MRSGRPIRARGAALLIMVMIVGLGATWYLVSRLNTESGLAGAAAKARNQRVLNTAKAALIGYVATQAIKADQSRPGALPCPEAPANFNDPLANGSDGTVSYPCTLPIVGRFPWRTLGLDKLVDASGEPLWYAVAAGWAGANTVINSDCASPASGMACATGRLTVDGITSDVIAVIIAPGPAFSAPAATGCAAQNQTRPATGTPDWRNYLECENATSPADNTFVTTKPPIVDSVTKAVTPVLNDQVVTITVGDVIPAIEAAIAKRIESEILPALQTVFAPATWGVSVGSNPILPFAAPFASPGPGTGTSSYQGASGTYAGLLPFNRTQGCTESASDPRCTTVTTGTSATTGLPALMEFSKSASDAQTAGSGSIRTQSTCAWQSATYVCTGEYLQPSISVTGTFLVTNVAMGLRSLETSKITCTAVDDVGNGIPEQNVACTASAVLQTNGSVTLTIATGAMPDVVASGWGTYANYKFKIERAAFGDHPLLSTTARVVNFSNGVAEIQNGQTVTGLSSGASGTAIVRKQSGTWGVDAAGLLYFSSVIGGPFQSGESLQVGGSAKAITSDADRDFGWFARNEWYRLLYYAVSPSNTAANVVNERSCTPLSPQPNPSLALPPDCRMVTTGTSSSPKSALLILAGRSINGNSRPSSVLADYLEFGNRTGSYETRTITSTGASAYLDTSTAANVYAIAGPVTIGRPFQFKAVNANTGASTLATTDISPTNLVNADGSSLAASQIDARAVSEAVYDGTRFILYKRPFNDRVISIGSN